MINNYAYKVGNLIFVSGQIHSISPTVVANGTFFKSSFVPSISQKMIGSINVNGSFVPTFFTVSTNGDIGISYSGSIKTDGMFFSGIYTIASS